MNTFPIEQFLDKARVAIKSNQKHLTMEIKDVQALYDSLAGVMTYVAGSLDAKIQTAQASSSVISVNMDGGGFN